VIGYDRLRAALEDLERRRAVHELEQRIDDGEKAYTAWAYSTEEGQR
jgi:hypothetical protein